jgi:hypothetical protein
VIQIDQDQAGYATSGERLGGPGAHAAQADHRHASGAQSLVVGIAMKPPQAAKPALKIGINRCRLKR